MLCLRCDGRGRTYVGAPYYGFQVCAACDGTGEARQCGQCCQEKALVDVRRAHGRDVPVCERCSLGRAA
jgi:hypothetical protein